MRILETVRKSYQSNRHGLLRIVLAVASLVSMVLTSGAGSHWN